MRFGVNLLGRSRRMSRPWWVKGDLVAALVPLSPINDTAAFCHLLLLLRSFPSLLRFSLASQR